MLGSEYFISDEQFEAVQRKVRRQNDLFSVLITFGGSDPTGLILKVLKTLAKSTYPEFVFKIVLGPGFTEEEDVDDIVACFPSMIEVFKNPPDLLPLFIDCDLAICSGGRTLYELNTLKVPTLAIASIEHEAPVINAFLAQKKLMAGLWAWDEQEFIKQLEISLGRIAKQGNDVFSNNCN